MVDTGGSRETAKGPGGRYILRDKGAAAVREHW